MSEPHRKLKAKCAIDGFSMAEVIEELARAYLAGKVKLPPSGRG